MTEEQTKEYYNFFNYAINCLAMMSNKTKAEVITSMYKDSATVLYTYYLSLQKEPPFVLALATEDGLKESILKDLDQIIKLQYLSANTQGTA